MKLKATFQKQLNKLLTNTQKFTDTNGDMQVFRIPSKKLNRTQTGQEDVNTALYK